MKIKQQLLVLGLSMVLMVSGCGGGGDSPYESSASITSATTPQITTSTDESIAYNGTFNEEVFDQIVQNIKIGDRTISLPCTLEDLGEDFSYDMDTALFDKENGFVLYYLLYKGEQIAQVTLPYNSDNTDVLDDCIKGLSFYSRKNNGVYIVGITTNDTEESIIETLGQPTTSNGDDEKKTIYYEIANDKYIQFQIANNKIIRISVQQPLNVVSE